MGMVYTTGYKPHARKTVHGVLMSHHSWLILFPLLIYEADLAQETEQEIVDQGTLTYSISKLHVTHVDKMLLGLTTAEATISARRLQGIYWYFKFTQLSFIRGGLGSQRDWLFNT